MPFILRPTVTRTFLDRVEQTPEAAAYQFKPTHGEMGPVGRWKKLTFRDHEKNVREISYGLRSLGLQKGDRAVILSNTRYEWATADLAILGSAAITVPIYASSTSEECAYILSHCEAKVAFVEDARQLEKVLSRRDELAHLEKIVVLEPSAMRLASGRNDVLTWQALAELGRREEAKAPQAFDDAMLAAKPSDLLTICYTSGTTGVPKGVMLTHDNVMSVLEDCIAILRNRAVPEGEKVITFLPYSHIIGKLESLATFVFGWEACFAENIDKLNTNLTEVRPTLMFAVPRIFEKAHARIMAMIEQSPPARRRLAHWAFDTGLRVNRRIWQGRRPGVAELAQYEVAKRLVFSKVRDRLGGRLKYAICGGAPLPREIGEFFYSAGITILEGYGLTETAAPIAIMTPDRVRFGWVGRPLPEVSLKIAEDGEILVKSRKVFAGYYKNPEATAEAIRNGWFHTGDIGEIDGEGFLRITDRKKDLIITSGGKNVAPQKIEAMAKSQKYISQFVVHGDRRNYLTALVTLDKDAVTRWAKDENVLHSGWTELVNHPKVRALVQKAVDQVNSQLPSFETIKKFIILPEEFTVETGELTPSLKVKRKVVNQKYKSELDHLYAEAAHA